MIKFYLEKAYPQYADQINRLYSNGLNAKQVSEMFDIPYSTVSKHFKDLYWWKHVKTGLYPVADMRGHGKTEPYYYNEMDYGSAGKINYKILIENDKS